MGREGAAARLNKQVVAEPGTISWRRRPERPKRPNWGGQIGAAKIYHNFFRLLVLLASSVLDETVEAKRVVVVAVAADLALVVFLLLVVVFPMVVVSPVVVVSLVEVLFLNQQRRSDNNNGQLFNDLLTASREFKTPAVGELVEGPPLREASLRREDTCRAA